MKQIDEFLNLEVIRTSEMFMTINFRGEKDLNRVPHVSVEFKCTLQYDRDRRMVIKRHNNEAILKVIIKGEELNQIDKIILNLTTYLTLDQFPFEREVIEEYLIKKSRKAILETSL